MNDAGLDSWRERMVAALYGELGEGERAELEAVLARDDTLRGEWEELGRARADLQLLLADPIPEPVPDLGEAAPRGGPRARAGVGRWALAAGVGFAAAATLFVGLLVAGLRVDRTGTGLLVRLDRSAAAADPTSGQGREQYLTRAEFMGYADLLAGATSARLDELERRQTAAQGVTARALYDALTDSQKRHYQDLRNRIELVSWRSAGAGQLRPRALERRPLGSGEEEVSDGHY